jgi:hypothetical protein
MSKDARDHKLLARAPAAQEQAGVGTPNRRRARGGVMLIAGLAMAALASAAQAAPSIANGNFSSNGAGTGACSGSVNQQITYAQGSAPGDAVALNSWTNTNTYSFVLNQNNSTSFEGGGGCIGLYGPTATTGIAAPAGSTYYLAVDGAYGGYTINNSSSSAGNLAYIYQQIGGLLPGSTYAVTFWMSASQQYTWGGPTTDQWNLGFSDNAPTNNSTGANSTGASTTLSLNNSLSSCGVSNPSNTNCVWYGSWVEQTVDLVANATSEFLWFMANDTDVLGNNQPPFSLLAGVSLSQTTTVPEPPAYAVLLVGLLALLGGRRFYRARKA